MKRNILYILAVIGMCFGAASCIPEEIINDTDVARHQIENLTCIADDEEVTLSWSVPEGWEPTDFLITYNDAAQVAQKIFTDGATTYTITGLVNDFSYTFHVQAIYGNAFSNRVNKQATPVTSRISVNSLAFQTADTEQTNQFIQLSWEKPSDRVLNYTLTYYPEMNDKNVVTKTIDKDATSYKIEGITNDDNYVISLVANYPKGAAEAANTTVYFKMAYMVSQTVGAIGQTIDFTFNKEAYPEATDIKWVFPGGVIMTGETAKWTINTSGEKEVVLSAKVGTKEIVWPAIKLNLRKFIVEANDFTLNGINYNGFKGSYPILSPDGKTVYGITFNGISGLYAYDLATGEEKWRYIPATNSGSYNPGTVNPVTGDIYYGTTAAGQFYCVAPDGKLKWTYTGAGSLKTTAPAVSADGTVVYITDVPGKLIALNADNGSEKWVNDLKTPGFAILINNDEIVLGCKDLKVRFINAANGKVKDEYTLAVSKQPSDVSGFALADDKKTAYLPLTGGGLACIDIVAKKVVAENIFAGNHVWVPVVASNGLVVAGSKDGSVYALTPDLKEVKWSYMHNGVQTNNVFNYSHLCANDEGKVFATSGQNINKIYIFDAATGAVLSSETYGDNDAYKQMGGNNFHDGFLYSAFIGAKIDNAPVNGSLIGQYVGGKRKFWGGPGGDICGSSCVQSPLLQ